MIDPITTGRYATALILVWAIALSLFGESSRSLSIDNRPVDRGSDRHSVILPASSGSAAIVAERQGTSDRGSIPHQTGTVAGISEHPADPALHPESRQFELTTFRPIRLILVGTLNTSSSL